MSHVTSRPWTRDAWERAKPWIMEQRQKLEDRHWSQADHLRTELFALRKPAPTSADTEDGYLYIHMPRKWIDFIRAGKTQEDREAEEAARGHRHHRVQHRRAAPSYGMSSPDIWRVRVDVSDDHPSTVLLDVEEPLENMMYTMMCIQPGLARLHAERDNVIQVGTKTVDMHREGDAPSIRIQAMVADKESYMRILPPAYWIKRNAPQLAKILGQNEYAATLAAAEDEQRAALRTVTNCTHRVWEEALPPEPKDKQKNKNKKSRRAARAGVQQDETAVPSLAVS